MQQESTFYGHHLGTELNCEIQNHFLWYNWYGMVVLNFQHCQLSSSAVKLTIQSARLLPQYGEKE